MITKHLRATSHSLPMTALSSDSSYFRAPPFCGVVVCNHAVDRIVLACRLHVRFMFVSRAARLETNLCSWRQKLPLLLLSFCFSLSLSFSLSRPRSFALILSLFSLFLSLLFVPYSPPTLPCKAQLGLLLFLALASSPSTARRQR